MASSGIGGQAVMEGVMMKNQERYAVAVRKPDQSIIIETKEYKSICKIEALRKIPIIRGVINFIDSLVLGMGTLTFSASFLEEEEESAAAGGKETGDAAAAGGKEAGGGTTAGGGKKDSSKRKENAFMGLTVFISILLAVAIFMVAPYYLSLLFQRFIVSQTLVIVLEGVIRLAIFIGYILLISQMKDIKRMFMYHGAEHKCINCIEHGLELTVENVKKSSKEHKRCGTSFLFFVIIVSIIATLFIRVDSSFLRLVLRLAIIPLVAGVSYEFIRLAGRSENPVVNFLSKPGLLMQKLTTKEPDEDMIEVGIASVEAVFDWKSYIARLKEGKA